MPPVYEACVGTTHGPRQVGGVTAYVDALTESTGDVSRWTWLARTRGGGGDAAAWGAWERSQRALVGGKAVEILEPDPRWRWAFAAIPRAMFAPGGRRLAIGLYTHAYGDRARDAMAPGTRVVHYAGTGWELTGFPLLAAARRAGARFTVHPSLHEGEWGDSELDGLLYRQADWVFAQTPHERMVLERLGVSPQRITVVGPGPSCRPDGDGARFRGAHGLGAAPLVLFVGRRTSAKGYHALCEAMREVWAQVHDCHLVVAGPATEPPYVPLPADRVIDLGTATEADKADALAACDLLCVPSTAESFGLVYVEAWSYGRPVIAGPAPAVADLVDDGVNGYRVTQSPSDIATSIVVLLSDRDVRDRMGAAGKRKQVERYSWPSAAAVYRDVFEGLVPDSGTTPHDSAWPADGTVRG